MAVIAVLLGGLFGFANFLAALFYYDMGFLSALGIYSASGTALAVSILVLTCLIQALASRLPLQLMPQDSSS